MLTTDAVSAPYRNDLKNRELGQERPQNFAFEERIQIHLEHAVLAFKEITRKYSFFHISFFAVACLELVAFVLFFSFLTQSTILAFSIAGIVLTAFSYFVLLFYFQAKKPEQLLEVRNTFVDQCKSSISYDTDSSEYHLHLSQGLYRLIAQLHNSEQTYYSLPPFFETLSPLVQKFSIWCHWKDLHQIKEMLLMMVVRENIELVKKAPTDLETHAGLASAYLSLCRLYQDPRVTEPDVEHLWIPPDYFSEEMIEKFKNASQRAIEEFKILDAYAPGDPWIHAQLAAIYRDLNNPKEEIAAYESILRVSPHEREVLLRLGILYFKQGMPAQALKLYEQLKKLNDPKSEELISYYSDL